MPTRRSPARAASRAGAARGEGQGGELAVEQCVDPPHLVGARRREVVLLARVVGEVVQHAVLPGADQLPARVAQGDALLVDDDRAARAPGDGANALDLAVVRLCGPLVVERVLHERPRGRVVRGRARGE